MICSMRVVPGTPLLTSDSTSKIGSSDVMTNCPFRFLSGSEHGQATVFINSILDSDRMSCSGFVAGLQATSGLSAASSDPGGGHHCGSGSGYPGRTGVHWAGGVSRPVEIRSQVTGILKAWFFKEGRDVKKGDRLYQIDPIPFQAAMLSAKAKIAQAEARLVQAKQNFARVKPLLAEQAVS